MKTRYSDSTTVNTSTQERTDSTGGLNYVTFYNQKANIAVKVISTLGPGVKDGHPLLTYSVPTGEVDSEGKALKEKEVVDIKDAPFVILQEFQCWVAKAQVAPYEPLGCWLTRKDFNATYEGCKVKESFVAQILVLSDTGPILAIAEVVGTKARFVADSAKALVESKTKDFIKANPDSKNVFSRFRQVGTWNIIPKTGVFGPWSLAAATFDVATEEQVNTILAWLDDASQEETRDAYQSVYDFKVNKLRELSESTPAI